MSDLLGPQQLGQKNGEVFLGRDFGHQANYSEQVAASIDAEVRRLIDDAHGRARTILSEHRETLDALATALVDKETLDTPELMEIIGSLPQWSPDVFAAHSNGGRDQASGTRAGGTRAGGTRSEGSRSNGARPVGARVERTASDATDADVAKAAPRKARPVKAAPPSPEGAPGRRRAPRPKAGEA
jgi:hypothetical protein